METKEIESLFVLAEAFITQEEEGRKEASIQEAALNLKRSEIYSEEYMLLSNPDLKEKGITNQEMRRGYVREQCQKLFEDKEEHRHSYGTAKAEYIAAEKNYILTMKKIDLEMKKII